MENFLTEELTQTKKALATELNTTLKAIGPWVLKLTRVTETDH